MCSLYLIVHCRGWNSSLCVHEAKTLPPRYTPDSLISYTSIYPHCHRDCHHPIKRWHKYYIFTIWPIGFPRRTGPSSDSHIVFHFHSWFISSHKLTAFFPNSGMQRALQMESLVCFMDPQIFCSFSCPISTRSTCNFPPQPLHDLECEWHPALYLNKLVFVTWSGQSHLLSWL